MSHSNITSNIASGNMPPGDAYDCVSCGTKESVPEESLYTWQYLSNPKKFRIQGTCMFCGSSTTLWYEDALGNIIPDDQNDR